MRPPGRWPRNTPSIAPCRTSPTSIRAQKLLFVSRGPQKIIHRSSARAWDAEFFPSTAIASNARSTSVSSSVASEAGAWTRASDTVDQPTPSFPCRGQPVRNPTATRSLRAEPLKQRGQFRGLFQPAGGGGNRGRRVNELLEFHKRTLAAQAVRSSGLPDPAVPLKVLETPPKTPNSRHAGPRRPSSSSTTTRTRA